MSSENRFGKRRDRPAGIPLEKLASGGYNKAAVIQKRKAAHLNQVQKYKKVLKRKAEVRKDTLEVKDNIASFEDEFFLGEDQGRHEIARELLPKQKKRRQQKDTQLTDATPPAHNSNEEQVKDAGEDRDDEPGPSRRQQDEIGGQVKHQQGQEARMNHQGSQGEEALDKSGQQQRVDWRQLKKEKRINQVQRMQDEQRQAREAVEAAKKKAQEEKAARQAKFEAAQKQRKEQKQRFFKRTRSGQPLMGYRMDRILSQLQSEQT